MVRVLGIADSDSYLKWSSATLAAMPADWQTEQVVVTNPIQPSAAQVAHAAGDRPVRVLSLARLAAWLLTHRPDVVMVACTGPVVQAILSLPYLRRGDRRPVLLTGLPGISIPATVRAVEFRAGADLFLVHSVRERREFAAIGAARGIELGFVLASLPFVRRADEVAGEHSERADRVLFAAQAKVPREPEQRRAVLTALAASPRLRPVVKLRAAAGEEQTHRERWPYPELWAGLVAEGAVQADAVEFTAGSMELALRTTAGFVTVSSTAALEAMGARIPVLVLGDFGVSAEMINLVFTGSGCLGTLDDLRAGRFFTASTEWLAENYFHPASNNDWLPALTALLERRGRAGLPGREPQPVGSSRSRSRWLLRLLLPETAWLTVTRLRARIRRLRRRALSLRGRTLRVDQGRQPLVDVGEQRHH
ncbi:hypothetical protein GCM10009841_24780 [Microlunatus panaciterrae]|uniref:Uncharacterized protein n=1 Tax=Microlunatus panaciterrae TaxID=400768 RepID=A0ABS2RHE6_9ACTN|nr:DUF6716 putative glycosyltransferase [Microlunatus panaciterrae]MBM7797359.1 hypothetical protein [Microlunatus panaciterrae]